jgi:hypothetical protein
MKKHFRRKGLTPTLSEGEGEEKPNQYPLNHIALNSKNYF